MMNQSVKTKLTSNLKVILFMSTVAILVLSVASAPVLAQGPSADRVERYQGEEATGGDTEPVNNKETTLQNNGGSNNGGSDGSSEYSCNGDTAICLCQQATAGEGETGAAEPIRIFFTILSVLGPVFATIFFVGMSVAGAAQLSDDYQQERRRVLILGFSVPISISFLNVIGNEIVGQSIDCFFP